MSGIQNPWEQPARAVGRYRLYGEIASGGMATVHLGQLVGPVGFSRVVAIKRLHSQYAKDPSFVDMFLDEARLAGRIRHPNVVSTLDVASVDDELFLVMDYVHGESLGYLIRASLERGDRIPPRIASAILINALLGLHAAHEATDDRGRPLNIVHRDISPQNILVGTDGVARVADFGVAKAASRVHTTQGGEVKGKVSYMSPEQLQGHDLDRRTDLFGAAIVLWEALAGKRLFGVGDVGSSVHRILMMDPEPLSKYVEVPAALTALLDKALSKKREDRFSTAREMAQALEIAMPPAGALEIGTWVEGLASPALHQRHERNALRASSDRPELTQRFPGAVQLAYYKPPITRPLTGADVTEISLVTGMSVPMLRSRKWPIAAALGGAVVLIGVLVAISKPHSGAKAAGQSEAAVLATATSAAPVKSSAVEPAEPRAAGVDVESLAKEAASAAPGAKAAPATVSTAVRPLKTKAMGCKPPYVLKADGTKKFKPECF